MEKPSRIELVERADRAIATAKILMQQFAWAIDQSIRSIGDSRRVRRIGRKLDHAAFAKIGRTVAPVSESDFDGFDANIAEAERVLRLARECGFSDLLEMIQKDIAAMLLPDITILLRAQTAIGEPGSRHVTRSCGKCLGWSKMGDLAHLTILTDHARMSPREVAKLTARWP